jgi:hypothetical protein
MSLYTYISLFNITVTLFDIFQFRQYKKYDASSSRKI